MKAFICAKLFLLVAGVTFLGLYSVPSYAANPPALSGSVSSVEEGKMEGVVVSAKRDGGTITVSVISDNQGHYAFPDDRLSSGDYHLKIRAIGYDLSGAGVVKVEAGKTTALDLKLQKTADISNQLTNAEWFMSDPEIKEKLIDGIGKMGVVHLQACIGCHPISVVLRSKFQAEEWPAILNRMANHSESAIYQPGEIMIPANRPYKVDPGNAGALLGKFLASINLSTHPDNKFPFEYKTFPRLKGRSTKVIITEYDLPRRASQPHDATVDKEGMVWYGDVGNGFIGRLNPKTGETKEWPVTNAEPDLGTIGTASIRLDKDGNPVFGVESRERTGRLDKATDKITLWNVGGGKVSAGVDGVIWTKDDSGKVSRIYKLNPKTGESTEFPVPIPIRFYDVNADSKGNVYASSLEKGIVGVLDSKTGVWALYPTPTPDSGPRRGDVDQHDRYWFAEYYSGKIGMFDPETKKITEYTIPPLPWSGAYDLVVDKNGEVWAGGEYNDNIMRLNPKTGDVTTYQMPTLEMNIQRMDVDNNTKPVAVWAGENHRARILKVEPLD